VFHQGFIDGETLFIAVQRHFQGETMILSLCAAAGITDLAGTLLQDLFNGLHDLLSIHADDFVDPAAWILNVGFGIKGMDKHSVIHSIPSVKIGPA